MDLKDFCDTKVEPIKKQKINIASTENELKTQAEKELEKYKNYSSDELMAELIKRTNEQKQNGSLSPEKLEQIYNTIANVLPPQNRENLDKIFSRLK